MRWIFTLVVWVAIAHPALAQFDLTQCRVHGSDPAVLAFPRTATLDAFGAMPPGAGNRGGYIRLATSGTEQWPSVAIDQTGVPVQRATLWVFLRINGQCHAAGAERLRPDQVNGTKPQGSPADLIGNGWLYDAGRWGPMAGYNPQRGERIGLMVVAGSTRSDNQTPVKARTNVLEVEWPGAAGADPAPVVWREGEGVPPPPPPPPVDVSPIYQQIATVRAELAQALSELRTEYGAMLTQHATLLADHAQQLRDLTARPVVRSCRASIVGLVPIACRVE